MRLVMERELRRQQDRLKTTGAGVILFGLWAFFKLNLLFLMGRSSLTALIETDDPQIIRHTMLRAYIILMILAVAMLILRYLVGTAAIRSARGGRLRPVTVVITVMLIMIDSASLISGALSLDESGELLIDSLVSMLVDATSVGMLIGLLTASVRYKIIQQELLKEATL